MLPCSDGSHMVLMSDERINKCCLAADFWAIVVMLRSTHGVMSSWGLGKVTALVNMVCSCRGCNCCSWEGTHINHVISLSDRWVRQPVASEWCNDSILGWWSIKGTLLWWSIAIMMHGKMEWITKHIRSGCHRMKVVSVGVQSLVCWKAVEGTATLFSR